MRRDEKTRLKKERVEIGKRQRGKMLARKKRSGDKKKSGEVRGKRGEKEEKAK